MLDTTYKRCYRCKYFSRDTRKLAYRKKFRLLRPKYWKFLLSKLNFWSIGYCCITVIDDKGEHINIFMKGYEACLFENAEEGVVNAKDFVGKIPDDPKKMEEAIRKVEQKQND